MRSETVESSERIPSKSKGETHLAAKYCDFPGAAIIQRSNPDSESTAPNILSECGRNNAHSQGLWNY